MRLAETCSSLEGAFGYPLKADRAKCCSVSTGLRMRRAIWVSIRTSSTETCVLSCPKYGTAELCSLID